MGKKLEEIEEIYLKLGKSRLENQDIVYLLSEVKRLREAIEKHKFYMWGDGIIDHPAHPADEELYKALEEEEK